MQVRPPSLIKLNLNSVPFVIKKEKDLSPDEELIEMYLKGEPSSFREILRRHTAKVMNFIMRYVHDKAAAEDLTQDVFISVLNNIDRFRGESRFKTYLMTIARNTAIDYLRKLKYRRAVSIDEPASGNPDRRNLIGVIPSCSPEGESSAQDGEIREAIEHAVEKLPPEQKEVFLLRKIFECQFSEIAEMLHENENTIKSRMRYALLFLQTELREFAGYGQERNRGKTP
jgi:RNA polymerase sigma-70 factor (ECF subfamily)